MEPLEKLQDWYRAQCDCVWEHTCGVSIETLDNPGWHLKIDVVDTQLMGKPFAPVNFRGQGDDDWYSCRVNQGSFEGFGSPMSLLEIIAVFISWLES